LLAAVISFTVIFEITWSVGDVALAGIGFGSLEPDDGAARGLAKPPVDEGGNANPKPLFPEVLPEAAVASFVEVGVGPANENPAETADEVGAADDTTAVDGAAVIFTSVEKEPWEAEGRAAKAGPRPLAAGGAATEAERSACIPCSGDVLAGDMSS